MDLQIGLARIRQDDHALRAQRIAAGVVSGAGAGIVACAAVSGQGGQKGIGKDRRCVIGRRVAGGPAAAHRNHVSPGDIDFNDGAGERGCDPAAVQVGLRIRESPFGLLDLEQRTIGGVLGDHAGRQRLVQLLAFLQVVSASPTASHAFFTSRSEGTL